MITPDAAGVGAGGVLVIGYGNVLRSDDGVGWAVAQRLTHDPRLAGADVRAQHQLTPELAADLCDASLLILVDASVEEPPGTVRVRSVGSAAGVGAPMSHHIEVGGLVDLALELWGSAPPVHVVSVGVASLDVGDRLSPAVEAAVPVAADAVAALVEARAAERGRA